MHRIHATIAASAFALVAMAGATAVPAQAQTEIQWWHAMSGANNETVENLAKEFNATQSDYKVVPVYKGTYPETLNDGWTMVGNKGGFMAQHEHTIIVTEGTPIILTEMNGVWN